MTQHLYIHPQYTSVTDRQTDERDDNSTIDAYGIAVIKKARQKCVQYRPNNQC